MSLPKRVYYPLPEAAERMGCGIRDVIHYGANGLLDFYVFLQNFNAPGDSWFHLNVPSKEANSIDCFGCLSGDGWMIYDIAHKKAADGYIIDGFYAKTISGFFHVNGLYLAPLEFSNEVKLETIFLSSEPDKDGAYPIDVNMIGFSLSLSRNFLCVREDDIKKIKTGVIKNTEEISRTVANNRSSMIKALLAIHYGEDVANSPRKFIENKDSEICKDFELKGIKLPSGKIVSEWLRDVEIDYV